ncbi:MAG: hypothetical protein ACYCYK_05690 [Candidatus Dormibacteria bacterium]
MASQLSEALEALSDGVASLTEVTTVWPDWLRLAKAFSDSYQVDPARALGALGSLDDPDQVDAAALGPLEREYLATLTLLLDGYRQNREEGSQEVFSFHNEGDDDELEHIVAGWGADGDYSLADAEADPANRGLGGLRGQGGISELRQVARMAAWGFVDQAGIEERWPEFFELADDLADEEGRWDLQDAHRQLGAEGPTRAAYLTGLLQLIDTTRTKGAAGSRPLSSSRVRRTWSSASATSVP